jgi:histidinol-phosphate/aromatic aminotransferase/cobyric acid decarboxylase-like protein
MPSPDVTASTNHVPVPGSITALQRLIDHHCTSGGQVMFSWPNFAAFPDLAAAHIHAKSAITVYVRTGMIASLVGEEMTPLLHAPGSFFGG